MKFNTIKDVYDKIKNNSKLSKFKIDKYGDYLEITTPNYVLKVILNNSFFDIYVNNKLYYDCDIYDIDKLLIEICEDVIVEKSDNILIFSVEEFEKKKNKILKNTASRVYTAYDIIKK